MNVAAQLYTVRKFAQTPKAIRDTFVKVKEMGYGSVQVSGLGPIDPNELLDIKNETGLTICVTHIPFDRIITETENIIAEHKLWGTDYIGLGSMPGQYHGSIAGVREFLQTIKPAIKLINDSGLKFVYHNHMFEFEKYDGAGGKTVMDIFAEETDVSEFGFLVDTYWVASGGVNPADFIKMYGDRIDLVHLKDMKIVSNKQVMASVGAGNLNWSAILDACAAAQVKWLPVEHDDAAEPFESLKQSIDYLKRFKL